MKRFAADQDFSDEAADDRVICERVRAELGRVASHPAAILVASDDGVVTLTGDVLAPEVPMIVTCVSGVRGVDDVLNEMTAHADAEGIRALQGASERGVCSSGSSRIWRGLRWPSVALAGAVAAGAALAIARASRRA